MYIMHITSSFKTVIQNLLTFFVINVHIRVLLHSDVFGNIMLKNYGRGLTRTDIYNCGCQASWGLKRIVR